MNRRAPPRLLTVLRKEQVSKNMLRITFGGDSLRGFPTGAESANVKLLLANPGQDWPAYLAALAGDGQKPLKRTYTVLAYREQSNELDIEVAQHDNPGPATRWAANAQPGDEIGVAGPGATRLVDSSADWFLLAGDLSALPAIITNINILAQQAKGYVVLEVPDQQDQRELNLPSGVVASWIINPEPGGKSRPLVSAVKSLAWLDGTPSVWVAGESDSVRELRQYFAVDRKLDRQYRYISGYWKLGDTEDSFQMVKRSEVDH